MYAKLIPFLIKYLKTEGSKKIIWNRKRSLYYVFKIRVIVKNVTKKVTRFTLFNTENSNEWLTNIEE